MISVDFSSILGCLLIGLLSGIWGAFLLLRRLSLFGDMVGHSVLPGICFGFWLAGGQKNAVLVLLGAFLSATLAAWIHSLISDRHKTKGDAAMAITLSGMYSLGIVFLSFLNDSGSGGQSGLTQILMGQAATISVGDIYLILFMLFFSLVILLLFYKEMLASSFDSLFSSVIKLSPNVFLFLIAFLVSATVILSIQAVGIILASAFLVIPAATAFFWSTKFSSIVLLSAIIGAFGGAVGSYLSSRWEPLPTGSGIILLSALVFFLSYLFSPRFGLLAKMIRDRSRRRKHEIEDLLRCAYYFYEQEKKAAIRSEQVYSRMDLSSRKNYPQIIRRAQNRGWLDLENGAIRLSDRGLKRAMDVARNHRIWELYLVQKMDFKSDHVHEDAEIVEHILSEEMVLKIEQSLGHPVQDPHGKLIPSIEDLRAKGVPGYGGGYVE